MKKTLIPALALICLLSLPLHAFAVDRDDDLAADTSEHIGYDTNSAAENMSAKVEAEFPDEAKEVRAALERHLMHANTKDLDGYMSDFMSERMRYPELNKEYAQRAMALKDLKLEVKAIEFQKLTRIAATVHTRQISTYKDESGKPQTDDVIISYRWLKDSKDGVWRIAFTERRRLTAP